LGSGNYFILHGDFQQRMGSNRLTQAGWHRHRQDGLNQFLRVGRATGTRGADQESPQGAGVPNAQKAFQMTFDPGAASGKNSLQTSGLTVSIENEEIVRPSVLDQARQAVIEAVLGACPMTLPGVVQRKAAFEDLWGPFPLPIGQNAEGAIAAAQRESQSSPKQARVQLMLVGGVGLDFNRSQAFGRKPGWTSV
jgi:hypothetical protein